MKFEIMQHVTEEFARLRDFISTLVPPSSGTYTSVVAPVMNEPNLWDDPHEDGQGSDVWSPHDDDRAAEAKMQEGNAGEGSDKRSPHDNNHADKGEMHAVNDREGGDEQSPEDDDCAEEGDMQDMNDTQRDPNLGSCLKVQLWRRLLRITYDVVDDVKGVYVITSIPYGDMVKWNAH
ncbi:Hypothetical predicted protein [Olea europaea subsp. europaea]|uniref:Uncharacterized protein n=1 Tax=Olea europaea subsp. europaea TaxID=158383 RepID=A0A8S0TMH0_OLEEU|nr:Hypothetical predicted protein [Olea europaea subsp. europaea]